MLSGKQKGRDGGDSHWLRGRPSPGPKQQGFRRGKAPSLKSGRARWEARAYCLGIGPYGEG